MISEYDHVRIKQNGITGIVVDISPKYSNGQSCYTVESDNLKIQTDSNGEEYIDWPMYVCNEDDLEKIE
jgi:heat shock protein HspQ